MEKRLLRVVPPQEVAAYAALHDEEMWRTLCALPQVDPDSPDHAAARALSTLPHRILR